MDGICSIHGHTEELRNILVFNVIEGSNGTSLNVRSEVKWTGMRFNAVLAASFIRTITLMIKAVSTSETSVNFYQTTRCNNPEDKHFQLIQRSELNEEPNTDAQNGSTSYAISCLIASVVFTRLEQDCSQYRS
jgi:hypothetical protein